MLNTHYSTNFVWRTDSIVGVGATAVVCKGLSKVTGDEVAVKIFKYNSPLSEETKIREFEMLRKMEHKNIVRLLAMETRKMEHKDIVRLLSMETSQQYEKQEVIVMELCTGGSLYDSLNDPENYYGLKESEFLLVLEHLCAGVKYLREHKIIHRDLKPGNILKFIHEDGTVDYKLADFGFARELEDNQSFQTMRGTVEYLNPDIYGQLLDGKSDAKFPTTADLWSIGVTLYHLATGELPFRSYGGRRDRKLYEITANKKSGVISVTQEEPNGPFIEKTELPKSCLLSYGTQKLITPVIANLLERDKKKKNNFNTFFTDVDLLLSHKVVHIFHMNNLRLIKLFILPRETYKDLQNYVEEQTGTGGDSQMLLYRYSLFGQECIKDSDFPKTTEADPLFLFDKGSNIIVDKGRNLNSPKEIPKWKNFPTTTSMEDDFAHVQRVCGTSHEHKRQIEKYSLYSKLIFEAMENYKRYIEKELKNLENQIRILLHYGETMRLACESKIRSSKKNTYESIDQVNEDLASFNVSVLLLRQNFSGTIEKREPIFSHLERVLSPEDPAPKRAEALVNRVRELWMQIRYYKSDHSLPPYYQDVHRLNKIKVTKLMYSLEKLMVHPYDDLAQRFAEWYKNSPFINSVDELTLQITKYEDKLKYFEGQLNGEGEQYSGYIKNKKLTKRQMVKMYSEYLANSPSLEQLISESNAWRNKINELLITSASALQ